jgi:hypothetical protein
MSKKRKVGRPSMFSSARTRRVILKAVARGVPLVHAARLAGTCYRSLANYRNSHVEFERELQQSLSLAIQSRLAIVERAMKSKDENIALRAATWWLTHTPGAAEYFSESRRLEVTGKDGEPLTARLLVLTWPHNAKENGNGDPIPTNLIASAAPDAG